MRKIIIDHIEMMTGKEEDRLKRFLKKENIQYDIIYYEVEEK